LGKVSKASGKPDLHEIKKKSIKNMSNLLLGWKRNKIHWAKGDSNYLKKFR